MANEYASTTELKQWMSPSGTAASFGSNDDTVLAIVNTAAARAIERHCGRHFYQQAAEARYFTAEDLETCYIDDLSSITSLKTDDNNDRTYETTWSTTDYDLEAWGEEIAGIAAPFRTIRTTPLGTRTFPTPRKGVEITGTWGWDAVPDEIKLANLMQAARWFKRKDSPFGVAGVNEFGVMRVARLDPDIEALLGPFVRFSYGAI